MIKQLLQQFEELDKINIEASEEINKAKEGSVKKIAKVTRAGKEVEITEKDLWEEIWNGANTDARDILKEKYPKVFELSEKAEQQAQEIQKELATKYDLPTNRQNLVSFGKLVKFIVNLIDKKYE